MFEFIDTNGPFLMNIRETIVPLLMITPYKTVLLNNYYFRLILNKVIILYLKNELFS